MLLFTSGFIVALILAGFGCLIYRYKVARLVSGQENHKRRLEELSKLTGGLAHEIKNPLSTIKINLKLITEQADSADPKYAAWLRKIAVVQKESNRLEQILDDFLRYIGKSELQLVSSDVNQLVGDMVDFYWPQARAANGASTQTGSFGIDRGRFDAPALLFWAVAGIPLAWGIWQTLLGALKIF